jgi:hypothetical protein
VVFQENKFMTYQILEHLPCSWHCVACFGGKWPSMGRCPNMGRCIISYQVVLSSLVKNLNHQADEAVFVITV